MHKTYYPKNMLKLFILFIVIQSQIKGGFTTIESNDIQFENNQPKENLLNILLNIPRKIFCSYLSDDKISKENDNCCLSIMEKCFLFKSSDGYDRNRNKIIVPEKSENSDNSGRSVTATTKYSYDSFTVPSIQADKNFGPQQDLWSQSTELSEKTSNDEEESDNNNDNRTTMGRRILLIILSSVVLIIIGIFCIIGVNRSTYKIFVSPNIAEKEVYNHPYHRYTSIPINTIT